MLLTRAAERRNRLTLTALVDVVFILLFFFMLATRPPAPRQLEVSVAPAASGPEHRAAAPSAALRIEVAAAGQLRLAGETLSSAALLPWLRSHGVQAVFLAATADASLQDLVGVLDQLRPAGLRVELVVDHG